MMLELIRGDSDPGLNARRKTMNESDATPGNVGPKSIERRTVLKMVAWATPAITLMSATPAFAASLGALIADTLRAEYVYDGAGNRTGIVLVAQIQNAWKSGEPSVTSLTLTFVLPPGFKVDEATYTGSGWSASSDSLSYAHGTLASSRSTAELRVTVPFGGTITPPTTVSWTLSSPYALVEPGSGTFSLSS